MYLLNFPTEAREDEKILFLCKNSKGKKLSANSCVHVTFDLPLSAIGTNTVNVEIRTGCDVT